MSFGVEADSYLWYIVSVLCFIAWIISIFPVIHTLYQLWIKKSEKISNSTRIVVSFAMILLYLHVSDHTFFRVASWIPGGFGIDYEICIIHVWFISTTYYIGKSLMYSYFVLRAKDIFAYTAFAYNNIAVSCALFWINTFSILLTLAWPLLDIKFVKISTIETTKGKQCLISSGDYDYSNNSLEATILQYELALATLLDIIFSIITVLMLVGKLFNMSNNTLSLKRNTEFFVPDSPSFGPLSPSRTMSKSYPVYKEMEIIETQKNSEVQCKRFHQITKPENKVLMISTKLLILVFVAIISAQLTLLIYLWISGEAYEFDSCINIFCLWLTFHFSDKYYKKLFCGKHCIKTYFPCFKAIAVGCDRDGNEINCTNTKEICCCCCIDSKYKEYYLLSKQEYKLYLSKYNGKSHRNSSFGKKTITDSSGYNTGVELMGNKYTLDEPLL